MVDNFVFENGDGLGFNEGEFAGIGQPVDHISRGLSRLPYQFTDSLNLRHLIEIHLKEIQEIEYACQDVLRQKDIEYATGVQLDGIGELVGVTRSHNQSDLNFRKTIKLKIMVNSSEGTYPEVYEILKFALETNNVEIIPEYPAGFLFIADVPIPQNSVLEMVKDAIPITVKMATIAKHSTNPAFCFFGGTGAGFGSVGYPSGTGGEFRGRKEYS